MVGINEISKNVAMKANVSPIEAKRIILALLEEIVAYVESGENVNVRGLGMFYRAHRESRKGTNPRTGKRITIPPREVLVFKPTEKIKYI